MKIISLTANNILKLSAVAITPDGAIVTLAGKNGAGKSSVLNSIAMALGGSENIMDRPIKAGASKGNIVVKLPGMTVTRSFTALGTALKITNDEGVPQKSPQGILDALVGNLTFDPLAFSRMKPADQLETVRALVGLDFSQQKAQRQKLFEERTLVNRDLKGAESRLAATPFDSTAPAEPVQVGQLMAQLTEIEATNGANASKRRSLEQLKETVRQRSLAVDQAMKALESARNQLKFDEDSLAQLEPVVTAAVDTDVAPLKLQIQNAGSVNAKVASNTNHQKIKAEVAAAGKKSAALTASIDGIDNEITEAMGKAKFPLPGLAFTDEGVTLNALPFSQASTAEKVRASVAMGMAMNPKLKVIFVRDGSLLDSDSLALVAEMAQKNDYQIWMEDARSTDPSAVVIEDGHVKDEEPAKEPPQQEQAEPQATGQLI